MSDGAAFDKSVPSEYASF